MNWRTRSHLTLLGAGGVALLLGVAAATVPVHSGDLDCGSVVSTEPEGPSPPAEAHHVAVLAQLTT